VDAIPHILCGGFSKEDTENFLIDLDFLEIDNVVALRGDALSNQKSILIPIKMDISYANELVGQIADRK
jgi:methylenetetrahydrofolate reductase (NADPH)